MESAKYKTGPICLFHKYLLSACFVLLVFWNCSDAQNVQVIFSFIEHTVGEMTEKYCDNMWQVLFEDMNMLL